jgi:hypothetical protein
VGREWWLTGPANNPGLRWRFGVDAGGRYGTSRLDLHEARHRTDVIGGAFAAAHTDLEWPCGGCCTFLVGFRGEWDYVWSDIIPGSDGDSQDVNLLVTFGVRY